MATGVNLNREYGRMGRLLDQKPRESNGIWAHAAKPLGNQTIPMGRTLQQLPELLNKIQKANRENQEEKRRAEEQFQNILSFRRTQFKTRRAKLKIERQADGQEKAKNLVDHAQCALNYTVVRRMKKMLMMFLLLIRNIGILG